MVQCEEDWPLEEQIVVLLVTSCVALENFPDTHFSYINKKINKMEIICIYRIKVQIKYCIGK